MAASQPADALRAAGGVDEEEEHLARLGLHGGEAGDASGAVGGDDQRSWWRVFGHELVPHCPGNVGRRSPRNVQRSRTAASKHGSDRRRVGRNRSSYRAQA
jgi:hypothetical protein